MKESPALVLNGFDPTYMNPALSGEVPDFGRAEAGDALPPTDCGLADRAPKHGLLGTASFGANGGEGHVP